MKRGLAWFFLATYVLVLLWSGWNPVDRYTWFLEVLPGVIGLVIVGLTYKRFPLSTVSYAALWFGAVYTFIGGHYTYALNPFFDWVADALGLVRNHYDRVGHFFQGAIAAVVAHDVFTRKKAARGMFLPLFVCCFALALSASYELIEWIVAVISGSTADAFLGMQGDVWDSQWDMFLALVGSIVVEIGFFLRKKKVINR